MYCVFLMTFRGYIILWGLHFKKSKAEEIWDIFKCTHLGDIKVCLLLFDVLIFTHMVDIQKSALCSGNFGRLLSG
jgi:hypothetical protein